MGNTYPTGNYPLSFLLLHACVWLWEWLAAAACALVPHSSWPVRSSSCAVGAPAVLSAGPHVSDCEWKRRRGQRLGDWFTCMHRSGSPLWPFWSSFFVRTFLLFAPPDAVAHVRGCLAHGGRCTPDRLRSWGPMRQWHGGQLVAIAWAGRLAGFNQRLPLSFPLSHSFLLPAHPLKNKKRRTSSSLPSPKIWC